MIRYIKGIYAMTFENGIVVENGSGMGFEINIPAGSPLYRYGEGEKDGERRRHQPLRISQQRKSGAVPPADYGQRNRSESSYGNYGLHVDRRTPAGNLV